MASANTQATSYYSPPQWTYDIFLSFRGKDTRNTFTAHLYANLKQRGIDVYMDDRELERGNPIEPALWKAIEESRFSIVIFSKYYASSPWCLDELVKIVQCMKEMGHTVLPVFYDVDPSDVTEQQEGAYKDAFVKHENEFRKEEFREELTKNLQKMQRWKECLTTVGQLSGWDVRNRNQSEAVESVVDYIDYKVSTSLPKITKNLVGIYSHLEVLNGYICEETSESLFIGIYGMGGIGKTTIARVIYDKICWQFEGSCFLAKVREVFVENDGPRRLQEQLLSEILMACITVSSSSRASDLIRRRLRTKKVLLVLDDVDNQKQLEVLAAECGWFGLGSRIIITTRDKNVLDRHGAPRMYKVKRLSDDDALTLFSWNAFKKDQPAEDFREISKQVVGYACGLPLALEVIGSSLHGRSVDLWESALNRLNKIPDGEIIQVLRISFDNLHELEKKIFLDIACFLRGMKRDRIMRILDGCGFDATIGIKVLMEKSLLSVSRDEVWVHNLLEIMGKEIVRLESTKKLKRRSRLWRYEDGSLAFRNIDIGEFETESIFLDLPKIVEVQWNMEVFSKMNKLRLLKIRNLQLSEGPGCLSNELRFLEWHGYPSTSLPSCFKPDNLVELDISYSYIRQLWHGFQLCAEKLKIINLSHSLYLMETPDFTRIPNLEKLILEGCLSLSVVHPSLGLHKNLQYLNLVNCKSLKSLPSKLEMESLRVWTLDGCSSLEKFPDIEGNMNCLVELCLNETNIEEIPSSIQHLVGLSILNVNNCMKLRSIPDCISGLKSLRKFDLSGCSQLKNLPENLGKVESLEELDVSGTSIRQPPASILLLKNLKALSFHGCERIVVNPLVHSFSGVYYLEVLDLCACKLRDGAVPEDIGCLSSLRVLDLSRNDFVSLPKTINQLSQLEVLALEACRMLKSLPEVPSKVQTVNLNDCISLKQGPDPSELCSLESSSFEYLNCWELYKHNGQDCFGLKLLKRYLQGLPHLRPGFGVAVPGNEIPGWFSHQNEGSLISVQVPPKLNEDSGWIGFVACVAFSATDGENPFLSCYLKASGTKYHHLPMCVGCNSVWLLSNHLWLFYLSFDYLKGIEEWKQESFSNIELSFHFYEQGVKVKKCGVCLVYSTSISSSSQPSSACLIVGSKGKEAASSSVASFAFSSYFCEWIGDVFLGFRAEDTSNNFAAYLHTALVQRGIIWGEGEVDREKRIESKELLKAIQESRLSIIISVRQPTVPVDELLDFIQNVNNDMKDVDFLVCYDVEPLGLDNKTLSCMIIFDEEPDDFGEMREKVERWNNILIMVADSDLDGRWRRTYRASTGIQATSAFYSPSRRTYDVFISIEGKDIEGSYTLQTFSRRLYSDLKQRGINVYMKDEEQGRERPIEPALIDIIKESRFSIVILSRNYISSPSCLNQLVKIVQCMEEMEHTVLPVFYNVDPLVAARLNLSHIEAFTEQRQPFHKMLRWRNSLTKVAYLSGWNVRKRRESKIIEEIVGNIVYETDTNLPTIKSLVGMDCRLEFLKDFMSEETSDILFIGICGVDGIGKTTIARVIYERIRWQFEGSCFLANVRNLSVEKDGPRRLQEHLLSEILMERSIVSDSSRGIYLIKQRLQSKKVLLILDDVDKQEELEMLALKHGWCGPGSRIIITSRNKNVLVRHGVTRIYEAEKLNDDDALMLFSWKAFKKDQPPESFRELSKRVVGYANGLPLALEVIGSYLSGRSIIQWQDAISRLNEIPAEKIIDVLRISLDGLQKLEKNIFLDIACIFNGMKKEQIIRILDSCGSHAKTGIQVLIKKSLLSVSRDRVWMHIYYN